MALKLANRAYMTVASAPGTGAIALGSAVTGYQSFAAGGVADGDTVPYTAVDGNAWEIGDGVYTAAGTSLARTLVESSSGALISLSASAKVFIDVRRQDVLLKRALGGVAGAVIQSVSAWYSTETAGATGWTFQTAPTNTTGTQIISLAITPTSASNKIRCRLDVPAISTSAAGSMFVALFRGSTLLAANFGTPGSATNTPQSLPISFDDSPASISPQTYTVRFGSNNGAYINGRSDLSAAVGAGNVKTTLVLEELSA